GPYALTLTIGPPEAFTSVSLMTPADARRTHARTGEVMLDGTMASAMPMGGMQRHLQLHVVDRAMGMAVTGAHVTMRVLGRTTPRIATAMPTAHARHQGCRLVRPTATAMSCSQSTSSKATTTTSLLTGLTGCSP